MDDFELKLRVDRITEIVNETTLSNGKVILTFTKDDEAEYCITVYHTHLETNSASTIYDIIHSRLFETSDFQGVSCEQRLCSVSDMNIVDKMLEQHIEGIIFQWLADETVVTYVYSSEIMF